MARNPAAKSAGCQSLCTISMPGASRMAAAPQHAAGRKRRISPVAAVPMPIVSRMTNRIGSRIGVNSATRLRNEAVRPATSHTLPSTRSTKVWTLPSVRLPRVKYVSVPPSRGISSQRRFHRGSPVCTTVPQTSSVVSRVTYPHTRNGLPALRSMSLRVFSIMRPISARLSAASSLFSSMFVCLSIVKV